MSTDWNQCPKKTVELKKTVEKLFIVLTGESSTGCYPCQWLHNPGGLRGWGSAVRFGKKFLIQTHLLSTADCQTILSPQNWSGSLLPEHSQNFVSGGRFERGTDTLVECRRPLCSNSGKCKNKIMRNKTFFCWKYVLLEMSFGMFIV